MGHRLRWSLDENPKSREYKDRRQFSTLITRIRLRFKITVNNLNMKLQGRISACLTVDRNIISKIIFRSPANSILELYNTWLQRHIELHVLYLKLNSKMHAIAWFICSFEACYPHWSFIQENIKILTDLKPHSVWTSFKTQSYTIHIQGFQVTSFGYEYQPSLDLSLIKTVQWNLFLQILLRWHFFT